MYLGSSVVKNILIRTFNPRKFPDLWYMYKYIKDCTLLSLKLHVYVASLRNYIDHPLSSFSYELRNELKREGGKGLAGQNNSKHNLFDVFVFYFSM